MLLIGPKSRLFLKDRLRKLPLLDRLLRASRERLRQVLHRRDMTIIKNLSTFSPPSGAGLDKTIAQLAVLSANQTFPFMVHFIEVINKRPFPEPVPITLCSNTVSAQNAATELKSILDKHGSDKAHEHNYHHLYGAILVDQRDSTVSMLEIGLGTNYPDVPSSMGSRGRPGASLRAFAEFLPRAHIYGADIDRRILFQETRITTFFLDQTNLSSFCDLASQVDCQFDIIIDDGLHSPNANIATLIFACENLKKGGWLVVEDIKAEAIPVWRVISALVPSSYRCWVIAAEGGFLFVMKRSERQIDEEDFVWAGKFATI
jgi:hypothetical protein